MEVPDAGAPEIPTKGLLSAASRSDLVRDGDLRVKAPTLVMTADQSKMQSHENTRRYQLLIPNSRLVVLQSTATTSRPRTPECVANVLAFIKDARRKA
jgi:pimeloyl-ACP methyl ester carboxylesterase